MKELKPIRQGRFKIDSHTFDISHVNIVSLEHYQICVLERERNMYVVITCYPSCYNVSFYLQDTATSIDTDYTHIQQRQLYSYVTKFHNKNLIPKIYCNGNKN